MAVDLFGLFSRRTESVPIDGVDVQIQVISAAGSVAVSEASRVYEASTKSLDDSFDAKKVKAAAMLEFYATWIRYGVPDNADKCEFEILESLSQSVVFELGTAIVDFQAKVSVEDAGKNSESALS